MLCEVTVQRVVLPTTAYPFIRTRDKLSHRLLCLKVLLVSQ